MTHSDPGLVNERTALAWQRTALSLIAGSVIVARLTFERLGAFALLSALIALPLSLWVFFESRRRYAVDAGVRRWSPSRSGRAAAALGAATAVLALTELAALLSRP